jgi:hypothetical protein
LNSDTLGLNPGLESSPPYRGKVGPSASGSA